MGVHRVGDTGDPAVRHRAARAQQVRRVLRTRDDHVRRVVNRPFQPGQRGAQDARRAQKTVIGHLRRQTTLIIEEQRGVMGGTRDLADQCAFVKVRVDQVGLEAAYLPQDNREERGVEIEFVPRRADDNALAPGNIDAPANIDARHILPIVVGADGNPVPQPLERANLLEGTDMRAVIGKKRCRCDHEHRK